MALKNAATAGITRTWLYSPTQLYSSSHLAGRQLYKGTVMLPKFLLQVTKLHTTLISLGLSVLCTGKPLGSQQYVRMPVLVF